MTAAIQTTHHTHTPTPTQWSTMTRDQRIDAIRTHAALHMSQSGIAALLGTTTGAIAGLAWRSKVNLRAHVTGCTEHRHRPAPPFPAAPAVPESTWAPLQGAVLGRARQCQWPSTEPCPHPRSRGPRGWRTYCAVHAAIAFHPLGYWPVKSASGSSEPVGVPAGVNAAQALAVLVGNGKRGKKVGGE